MTDLDSTDRQRFVADTVWERHSNPKSGWSRLLSVPILVFALYSRKWKLLGLTALFLVFNPVLFSEPEEETVDTDWMYRAVQAEQFWTADGNRMYGLDFPQVLNVLSAPVGLYGIYAAYKKNRLGTVVCTTVSIGLNQWFVREIIKYHEAAQTQSN